MGQWRASTFAGAIIALGVSLINTEGRAMSSVEVSPGVSVLSAGAINVGVIRAEGRVLLVGCAAPGVLERGGVRPSDVDWVLLTHHFRDEAEGARELAAMGAKIAVPAAERTLFEHAEAFWSSDEWRVHAYHYHPSPRTLRVSVPVDRALAPGDAFEWRGVEVRALDGRGPTDGGLAYAVTANGRTVAFAGDLIYGPGQLRDLYSLQGERTWGEGDKYGEYHGFGERAAVALRSLDGVLAARPSVLVPTHGIVIREAAQAVAALRTNLDECLRSYWKTSAGRWYFAGARPEWPVDIGYLKPRCRKLPSWVVEVGGTSRAIVAGDGHCIVVDCAGDVPSRVAELQRQGKLGAVDAIWVTHYHDDHVGAVNELRAAQQCAVVAHETMADILQRPDAYLMPCLDPQPIRVDRVTRDGETWSWRGFTLTALSFPGQTFYDAALLVQRGDERVLFLGDSFTPGGMDDYCALNRNLVAKGHGYDRCLDVLEKLGPSCLLVNEHVDGAFAFTEAELAEMRAELGRRREALRRLLPWDEPDYGLDPQWARCDPYLQRAAPGMAVGWNLRLLNHSRTAKRALVRLRAPEGWKVLVGEGSVLVRPGRDASVHLAAVAPPDASGRAVVGFEVRWAGADLGELAEGVVQFGGPARGREP